MEAAKYYSATDYIKAQRVRTILMQEMDEVFAKCDVMAVPGNTGLPGKLEPPETARSDVKPGSVSTPYRTGNTMIGSVTGIPELIVPCGFSSGTPSLPISIGFYGKAFDEATLFRVGHAYESATEWHKRRPPI
jgi:aspartyl-tRNA(Asn)/glutamyl-tRNA(Gln) amidotransferase subunit A